MKIKYALMGIIALILGAILIGYYSQSYQYGDSRLAIGKQYTLIGVIDCDWRNNTCTQPKAGPFFELCEWDTAVRTFKEAGRYPNCINIDIWVGNEQISEYEKYHGKNVELTGTVKSIKWGAKGEDCNMVQIGCERDMILFVPEKITIISE